MRGRRRCPYHHKATWRTYEQAAAAIVRLGDTDGRPYWCAIAGAYEITRSTQAEYDRRQTLSRSA